MVFNPLLVEAGVHPQVAAATSVGSHVHWARIFC